MEKLKDIDKIKDIEKIKEIVDENKKKLKQLEKEPEFKITFKRVLIYFIIYSILGFVVETVYGVLTKGVLESRQSCLYGPFCCIYGLGAAIMIPGLQKFKKSNWTLAIAGAIEGSMIEYIISWLGEIFFQIKWWDYSNMPLNINGRICLLYTFFWGILALGLMRLINPFFERMINKMGKKMFNIISIGGTIILLVDILVTSFALKIFYTRLNTEYDLNINANSLIVSEKILDNQFVKFLSDKVFTDEKMLKTFPNIQYENAKGEIIWVKDVLKDIQPYYFKISDKIRLK